MLETLASSLLFKIASPAFKIAYERAKSISEAKDDLKKLMETIEEIKAVLLDAEKQQETSADVKNWIKRVRDVLYDADDLFDEVATDDMLKQQTNKENKLLKKVWVSCFKLNPVVSRDSIAKEIEAIENKLLAINGEKAQFKFKKKHEEPISRESGSFVDSKEVFGRDKEKNDILRFLLRDQTNDCSVIAIVGIGGIGKTTLAQLFYNDERVRKNFDENWFACISDISTEKIVGKILQSIRAPNQNYDNFTTGQIQDKIRDLVRGKKFFLVLDDVWDDDYNSWLDRMGLLKGCVKGSKIIVTTRSQAVARAVDAVKICTLDGLSEDESWALFKRIAFTPDHEGGSKREELGKKIVKKCANVPLAIKIISSLLRTKRTIKEWESISKVELTEIEEISVENSIISALKLSYDHLNSNIKHCFAYCSLFPKDYIFPKHDLIYLWIAQGYIKPRGKEQTLEEVGHSYFMNLFRMSFFQEAKYDRWGEICGCKMHDLIHDLAQRVTDEESITLPTPPTEIKGTPRHAKFGCIADDSSGNLVQLWNGNRLRSYIVIGMDSTVRFALSQKAIEQLKFLRTLKLSYLGITEVPSSIGELKLLRYLDISRNGFKRLPKSITKLLNLCTLDLSWCFELEALPNDLRKLVNLRHLKIMMCLSLRYVPPGFRELDSLQHLDEFNVGTGGDQGNKLGELFGLKISGELDVQFRGDSKDADWNEVKCLQPLEEVDRLHIDEYHGTRIPHWVSDSLSPLLPKLTGLSLLGCDSVKCLPPFRQLPNLMFLILIAMDGLEYIEEEEEEENVGNQSPIAGSDAMFLPPLQSLQFFRLKKLKGWSRRVEAALTSKDGGAANGEEPSSSTSKSACALLPSFPSLVTIDIIECGQLQYMPLCPKLRELFAKGVDGKVIPQLLSVGDHSSPSTSTSAPSSSLETVDISLVGELMSFPGQSLTSLRHLKIDRCERLELPSSEHNVLEVLDIRGCQGMLEEMRFVDWDSLPNLQQLEVDSIPSPERLPDCLRNLQSQGKLQINDTGSLPSLRSVESQYHSPFYMSNRRLIPPNEVAAAAGVTPVRFLRILMCPEPDPKVQLRKLLGIQP